MSTATKEKSVSHSSKTQDHSRLIRLLLVVWFFGGENVSQGEITKRIKSREEKSADCQKFFAQLENDRAIKVVGKKVFITDIGKSMLSQGLQSTDLDVKGTIAGSWMVMALLKWIQQSEMTVNGMASNGKSAQPAIASYQEFKQAALEAYDHLNCDYNFDDLVPIYRIRQEIGDKVSRSKFNEWILDLQANDILQLIGGEMPSLTPEIAENSIETKLGGARYYAKRL